MAPYATAVDLANRWRVLNAAEQARAEVLLGDATVWLRTWFPDLDSRVADGELYEAIPIIVSCAMVKRAMLNSDAEGVSAENSTMVAGPMTDTLQRSYSNPDGSFYLTAKEIDLLLGHPRTAVSIISAGL